MIVIAFVFAIGAAPGIGRSKIKHSCFYKQDLANITEIKAIAENLLYTGVERRRI
jgi:hypothetical protein